MLKFALVLTVLSVSWLSCSADPLAGTSQEDTPQDARYAQLAQQQVHCLAYAGSAYPGTATDEEIEALFEGAVDSLTKYARRARSGSFEGSSKVPMYMMFDGLPSVGSIEFSAGRLFEVIRAAEMENISKYEGLLSTDFSNGSDFGDPVPAKEWPDRAAIMFSKSRCRAVANGELQCLERFSCTKLDAAK